MNLLRLLYRIPWGIALLLFAFVASFWADPNTRTHRYVLLAGTCGILTVADHTVAGLSIVLAGVAFEPIAKRYTARLDGIDEEPCAETDTNF